MSADSDPLGPRVSKLEGRYLSREDNISSSDLKSSSRGGLVTPTPLGEGIEEVSPGGTGDVGVISAALAAAVVVVVVSAATGAVGAASSPLASSPAMMFVLGKVRFDFLEEE